MTAANESMDYRRTGLTVGGLTLADDGKNLCHPRQYLSPNLFNVDSNGRLIAFQKSKAPYLIAMELL